MGRIKDLSGQTFERLVVSKNYTKRNGKAFWMCKCTCGTTKYISSRNLIRGNTKSCGCLKTENLIRHNILNTRHGAAKNGTISKEYRNWSWMKDRCLNKNNTSYKKYGGRGISVCKRWLKFENFLEDMGRRPAGKTLDRIDGRKGYCKDNCRWATPKEQANNMKSNLCVSYKGKTKTLAQWCGGTNHSGGSINGISYSTARQRLNKGWSAERAFNKPSIRKR